MSTKILPFPGEGSGGGGKILDWLSFELTLDMLAAESSKIAANPSAYTGLLNKTVEAAVNGETLQYEIVDLARYDKSDGSGKAGVVLMPKTLLSTLHSMHSSAQLKGGWSASDMRTWLNGLSRPSQAVQVKVPYTTNENSTTVSYSDDYLFIPAFGELFGKGSSGNTSVEGDIFAGATDSKAWRMRTRSGYESTYWLRTISKSPFTPQFYIVSGDGGLEADYAATYTMAVLPLFCI